MKYKIGDVIFLAMADSSSIVEHLVRVDDIIDDHCIASSKVVSMHKMPQQSGNLGYILIPGFGIISDNSTLHGGESKEIYINLKNFDVHGKVTDSEILKAFENFSAKLIVPETVKKGIIG